MNSSVLTSEKEGKGSGSGLRGLYWWLGRIIGFVSLGLLIFSILIGTPFSEIKHWLNKKLGGKKRVRLHCWISYLILATTLIHAVFLMTRKYSEYAYIIIFSNTTTYPGPGIILGDISLILMFVVAVNGIYQRRLMQWMGYKKWKYIHLYGSVLALVLAIIHMLLIGSSFTFLKS